MYSVSPATPPGTDTLPRSQLQTSSSQDDFCRPHHPLAVKGRLTVSARKKLSFWNLPNAPNHAHSSIFTLNSLPEDLYAGEGEALGPGEGVGSEEVVLRSFSEEGAMGLGEEVVYSLSLDLSPARMDDYGQLFGDKEGESILSIMDDEMDNVDLCDD